MKGDKDRRKHGGEASVTLAPGEPPLLEKTPHGPRFAKGHKRHGGRRPGSPNKSTLALRELVHAFNEYGAQNALDWLKRAAKTSPNKAVLAWSRLLEYELPKMRAVENSGPGGGPVVVELVELDGRHTTRPPKEDAVQDAPDGE